jgi:hypothetical protein
VSGVSSTAVKVRSARLKCMWAIVRVRCWVCASGWLYRGCSLVCHMCQLMVAALVAALGFRQCFLKLAEDELKRHHCPIVASSDLGLKGSTGAYMHLLKLGSVKACNIGCCATTARGAPGAMPALRQRSGLPKATGVTERLQI